MALSSVDFQRALSPLALFFSFITSLICVVFSARWTASGLFLCGKYASSDSITIAPNVTVSSSSLPGSAVEYACFIGVLSLASVVISSVVAVIHFTLFTSVFYLALFKERPEREEGMELPAIRDGNAEPGQPTPSAYPAIRNGNAEPRQTKPSAPPASQGVLPRWEPSSFAAGPPMPEPAPKNWAQRVQANLYDPKPSTVLIVNSFGAATLFLASLLAVVDCYRIGENGRAQLDYVDTKFVDLFCGWQGPMITSILCGGPVSMCACCVAAAGK